MDGMDRCGVPDGSDASGGAPSRPLGRGAPRGRGGRAGVAAAAVPAALLAASLVARAAPPESGAAHWTPAPPGPLAPAQSADTIPVPRAGPECPAYDILDPAEVVAHPYYLTRAIYTSGFGGRGFWGRGTWAVDFPKADRQFLYVLRRLLDIDAFPCENPVRLDDPALRAFPYLYIVEPGRNMELTRAEAEGLRNYLLAGGFVHVDDFWGTREWAHFEREMREVFPDRSIVEIPMDHPVFHIGFEVEEVLTVPSIGNARRGVYHEQDGTVPYVRGIFDDAGRLMMVITWNSDLGDAWEWAEQPTYPRDRSDYAFQLGVNFVLYAMTH